MSMSGAMKTERTPLSVDFGESSEQAARESRLSRRRSLLVLAVVGSLLVVGGAGYAAFKSDKKGQAELDFVAQEMGASAVGDGEMSTDVVGALVGEDVETETEADAARVGPAPGTLISCGGASNKYVVMNGKKRWIPNAQTFANLFGAAGLKKVKALSRHACKKIRTGKHMSNGARLIQCKGFPHVLLESNRMKRWICNPATMNMYSFDWKKIVRISIGQCNKICNGPTLCNVNSYKKSAHLTTLNTKLGVQCPPRMIGLYACPPGSHETGVDNLGNCICKLCPPGFYCRGGYRSKLQCPAGTYQRRKGQALCVRAAPGYYVPKAGSVKQYLCPHGQYQYGRGATACRRSNPGWYIVMVKGVAMHKKCPRGTYQPKAGQKKCVKASPGYFVPAAGWSRQRPCYPGTYQAKVGAWACVKASKGYFVPGAGSKVQYKCHFGTYQGKVGQRGCRMASPGFYVARMGSWKQMRCPKKTYQHCYGQKQCIGCPGQASGAKYLPRNAQKQCGFGGKAKAQVNQVKFKPPIAEDEEDSLYDGRFDDDAEEVAEVGQDETEQKEGQQE